jgi:hypothetical protein
MTFGRLSEYHEDYHVIDQNVARKRTWEIDSLGNRPPRFTDEVFATRHRGAYDPRQRWCLPVKTATAAARSPSVPTRVKQSG